MRERAITNENKVYLIYRALSGRQDRPSISVGDVHWKQECGIFSHPYLGVIWAFLNFVSWLTISIENRTLIRNMRFSV